MANTVYTFRRLAFVLLLSTVFTTVGRAQDPVFSQFYAAPLQLNPAFAGNAYAPFLAMNYRSQWASFTDDGGGYSTYAVSYDQFFKGFNSGFGISLLSDNAGGGLYKRNMANLVYSYRVPINNELTAKIGIEAGIIQNSIDYDRLIFLDQLDPITGARNPDGSIRPSQEVRPAQTSRTLLDIGTGFLMYGKGLYVGFVAKHLNTPNEGFLNTSQNLLIGMPTRFTLHGGYEIVFKRATRYRPAMYVSPNILFVKQGDLGQINVGAYGSFGSVFLGAWFRQAFSQPDAGIVTIGFQQDYFKLGYSYDFSVGRGLAGRSGGSHEVSLIFNFDPDAGKRIDINDCFKMFR
jgi:type IX secretion system PorP/SprF family membrane protein